MLRHLFHKSRYLCLYKRIHGFYSSFTCNSHEIEATQKSFSEAMVEQTVACPPVTHATWENTPRTIWAENTVSKHQPHVFILFSLPFSLPWQNAWHNHLDGGRVYLDYEWSLQPITAGKCTAAQEHVPSMPHFTFSVEQEASWQEVELDWEPQVQPQKPVSSSGTLHAK